MEFVYIFGYLVSFIWIVLEYLVKGIMIGLILLFRIVKGYFKKLAN